MIALAEIKQKITQEPTFQKLAARYRALSVQERLILKGLLGVLALALVIQITLVPLYERNQQLSKDLDKQLQLYNLMAANGYRFGGQTTLADASKPLLSEVTQSAKRQSVSLSRYEQDGNSLRVWFDGAPFDRAAVLLEDLASRGIIATQINIDRQNQSGRVNIRATLSR